MPRASARAAMGIVGIDLADSPAEQSGRAGKVSSCCPAADSASESPRRALLAAAPRRDALKPWALAYLECPTAWPRHGAAALFDLACPISVVRARWPARFERACHACVVNRPLQGPGLNAFASRRSRWRRNPRRSALNG